MTAKNTSGSFDITLNTEEISGRDTICLSFGSGLFRKLGWSSGDWLQFDLSKEGFISLHKIDEPVETSFYAKQIKLVNGFYKICFYSKQFSFPKNKVDLNKEKAIFNLNTRTLSLEIPEEYLQKPEEIPSKPMKELQVEDIAAAFRKL